MRISVLPNYFSVVMVFLYLNSNALASGLVSAPSIVESTIIPSIPTTFSSSGSSSAKATTHYGIGFEQRMSILNNQTRSTKSTVRGLDRVQKISRPVRPYRPQRPVRPGR